MSASATPGGHNYKILGRGWKAEKGREGREKRKGGDLRMIVT